MDTQSPTTSSNFEQRMEVGDEILNSPTAGVRDQIESGVSFDIENGHTISKRHINSPSGLKHMDYQSLSKRDIENPISATYVLKTLVLILVWYTFSTFLTLYNKTLLGDKMGRFPAPLLMNTFHFTMQAALSTAIMWFWSDRLHSSVMSWKDYFSRVVPTALSTAMDVNLSNASLISISVTFATMCKSASPIFLLIFAVVFRLESPSVKLFGIIFVISVGILLTVAKETQFEFYGFVLVMLASVMAGFRWTMTQILLQVWEAPSAAPNCFFSLLIFSSVVNYLMCSPIYIPGSIFHQLMSADTKTTMKKEEYGLRNPLRLMSYVAPVMATATALFSLLLDPWHEFNTSDYFNSSWNIARSCLLMLFGGTLAFCMVLTEYILVLLTSAVTVTIAGVVKEAVTILVAVFYFHDEFTPIKGVGLITIMIGVALFNWYKYQKLQKSKKMIGSPRDGPTPKYVILDEIDEEEEGP